MSSLDQALRQFEATEANLRKLEKIWEDMSKLIPSGVAFEFDSPVAQDYEKKGRAFTNILNAMPSIDGLKLEDVTPGDLDEIGQMRFDAMEVGELEAKVSVENWVYRQGKVLREYRYKLEDRRRALVRSQVKSLLNEVDGVLASLEPKVKRLPLDAQIRNPLWKKLEQLLDEIVALLGDEQPDTSDWRNLWRHIKFGQRCDFQDIVGEDWPAIRHEIEQLMYGADDPIPIDSDDLGELAASQPHGSVTTKLGWSQLDEDEFERLIFRLVDEAPDYEDVRWVMRTKAPDGGRDISAYRVYRDSLRGPQRQRVIFQCKHLPRGSVNLATISEVREQLNIWEPPAVDVLVFATSGRFTKDAVTRIEQIEMKRDRPLIEMWADSDLERMLARRPHLIAEFKLR